MKKYHYFVEGKCEKKLINVLKEQKNLIIPGKIEVFNVIQEHLSELKLRTLSPDTIIIFVFDTDIIKTDILKENIKTVSKGKRFKEVWCVMQVSNLEEEIVRATCLKDVKDLFCSENLDAFKEQFIKEKNLYKKLCDKDFKISKMWISNPKKGFDGIQNDGHKIKK